jgi:hypothetical protein
MLGEIRPLASRRSIYQNGAQLEERICCLRSMSFSSLQLCHVTWPHTTAYSIEFPSITPTLSPFLTPTDSKPRANALLLASREAYVTRSFWCFEMTLEETVSLAV